MLLEFLDEPNFTIQTATWQWSRFMRLIMQHSPCRITSKSLDGPKDHLPRLLESGRMSLVLQYTPDDILVRMLRYGWFKEDFLLAPSSLEGLCHRGTSRVLEALLDYSGLSNILEARGLGLAGASPTLAELFEFRTCKSGRCRQAWRNSGRDETFHPIPPSSVETSVALKDLRHALDQVRWHQSKCRRAFSLTDYYMMLEHSSRLARLYGIFQILDLLAHCENRTDTCFLTGCDCHDHMPRPDSFTETEVANQPKSSPLIWHRCYHKANGDATKALQIHVNLLQVGSQANIALNWPAGYVDTRSVSKAGKPLPSKDKSMSRVKLSIQIALYQWSFRLSRSKRKAFSEADLWFMSVKMVLCTRERQTQGQLTRLEYVDRNLIRARRSCCEDEGESLGFKKGDIITLMLRNQETGWVFGRTGDGRMGGLPPELLPTRSLYEWAECGSTFRV